MGAEDSGLKFNHWRHTMEYLFAVIAFYLFFYIKEDCERKRELAKEKLIEQARRDALHEANKIRD